MPVEKGATYKLTVWHKCTNENLKFNVIFNFYQRTEDDDDWKGDKEYSFTTKKDKWVKFEQEVKIPEDKNIDVAGMSIIFPFKQNGKIYLDDISLTKSEGGSSTPETQKLEKPELNSTECFQQEITVS